jgi:hypothetical protein
MTHGKAQCAFSANFVMRIACALRHAQIMRHAHRHAHSRDAIGEMRTTPCASNIAHDAMRIEHCA